MGLESSLRTPMPQALRSLELWRSNTEVDSTVNCSIRPGQPILVVTMTVPLKMTTTHKLILIYILESEEHRTIPTDLLPKIRTIWYSAH